MKNDTYLNVNSCDDDPYTIKISGQIRPVAAVNEYDFTPLVDSLIAEGYTKKEAHDMVREICEEIITEITQLQEEE